MKTWNFINGWSLKIARVNRVMLVGFVMTIFNQSVHADNKQIATDDTPSIEFLEFLGDGVAVEQEFLDPMNYSEIETDTKQNTTKQFDADKIDNDNE